MSKGMIFDIKEFTVHDGPGIRTTVFFKGCPLRCLWCHNPEGIGGEPQLMVNPNGCTGCGKCRLSCKHEDCRAVGRCVHICPNGLLRIAGREIESAELAEKLMRKSGLYGAGGGVTLSGGEPLAQPEFLFDLLDALRPVHTAIETSGVASDLIFQTAVQKCSLIYIDLKHLNSELHKRLTGVDNTPILRHILWLKKREKPFVVRVPLIPGMNDDTDNLFRIAEFLKDSQSLLRVEFLPFNPYTKAKYDMAGMDYKLGLDGFSSQPAIPLEAFEKNTIKVNIL